MNKFDATDPSTYPRTVSIDGLPPAEYFAREDALQASMDRHPAGKRAICENDVCEYCGELIKWAEKWKEWHTRAAAPQEHYVNVCHGNGPGGRHALKAHPRPCGKVYPFQMCHCLQPKVSLVKAPPDGPTHASLAALDVALYGTVELNRAGSTPALVQVHPPRWR